MPFSFSRLGEVGAPIPTGHREVDARVLGGDAHLLRAAPCDGADVALDEPLRLDHVAAGLVDLCDAIGDLEAEDVR